jgi:hypothetical protein
MYTYLHACALPHALSFATLAVSICYPSSACRGECHLHLDKLIRCVSSRSTNSTDLSRRFLVSSFPEASGSSTPRLYSTCPVSERCSQAVPYRQTNSPQITTTGGKLLSSKSSVCACKVHITLEIPLLVRSAKSSNVELS